MDKDVPTEKELHDEYLDLKIKEESWKPEVDFKIEMSKSPLRKWLEKVFKQKGVEHPKYNPKK